MKNKKKDFDKDCNATSIAETNLFKKVTLEVLNEKHNALARYIGIPCVVEASAVLDSAVCDNVRAGNGGNYLCYRVDLRHFKGEFAKVCFRAATDCNYMALGYIVDKNGRVECAAQAKKSGSAVVTMPLTANSDALFASVPAKNGKPKWRNIAVELLGNGGVIQKVNDALNTLLGRIEALENRLEDFSSPCETEVKINLQG